VVPLFPLYDSDRFLTVTICDPVLQIAAASLIRLLSLADHISLIPLLPPAMSRDFSSMDRPSGGGRRKQVGDSTSGSTSAPDVASKLNPAFLALSRLK
jgi:hypothetical protein